LDIAVLVGDVLFTGPARPLAGRCLALLRPPEYGLLHPPQLIRAQEAQLLGEVRVVTFDHS